MATAVPQSSSSKRPENFTGIFWISNWMEVVERFAYYGVRVVLPVFMVETFDKGGPEFDHVQKGTIYAIWALVQSLVPIFTGGFADRYGYKINIAVATALKIVGYILMGYCIILAEMLCGMPLEEARPLGVDSTYEIFFAGAMFLALGTAIFKPGLQGLVAHQMPEKKAAFGWAIFYQMVNFGGFVGPLLAGYLRILDWQYVFVACSIGIALNFIPLFLFAEPEHHGEANQSTPGQLLVQAIRGLLEPRLFFFTIMFAGFWLMFYQLFDILPNFINDWVDSRGAASGLQSFFGEGAIPTVNGGNLTQEWIINFNALLISCFAFAIGWATGKVRSLTAIVIGIAISAAGIYGLGLSMSGWWILAMIALFSLGEMSASPTKMRYLASIAPPGKDGLYMGYVNFTVGIGWSVGSIIAGDMYQAGGDKVVLARRYLVEHADIASKQVADMAKADVLPFFEKTLGVDPWQTRELLWNTYEPHSMWQVFTLIGIASLIGILIYNYITRRADKDPEHPFNTSGDQWVRVALVPIIGAFLFASYDRLVLEDKSITDSLAVMVLAGMFITLLIFSFIPEEKPAGESGAASGGQTKS